MLLNTYEPWKFAFSAENDEIIENYVFLSAIFDDLVKVIKKLKFYKIENDFILDLKNRLKLITSFTK